MVEYRSPKPWVACSSRVTPARFEKALKLESFRALFNIYIYMTCHINFDIIINTLKMEVLVLSSLFNINYNIGFIGSGNMGGAIINGIVKNNLVAPEKIYISEPNEKTRNKLVKETGCSVSSNNIELIKTADIIIVAVKPNVLSTVLEEIKDSAGKDKLIISIVAGKSIGFFKSYLGDDAKVVRTMPNTPAMVSEGMTIIAYGDKVDEEDKARVAEIFKCVGEIEIFPEKLMNEVIALTSSSPAYIFQMIEAMADAAVFSGIPRDVSYKLAAQAVMGSAKMVLETGRHPEN